MTQQKYTSFSLSWDLDPLFPGGSHSSSLSHAIHHLKHQIQEFQKKIHLISDLKKGILHFQEIEGHCHDLQEFINCLLAQNIEDQKALQLNSQILSLRASCDTLSEEINAHLSQLDEETFTSLIDDSDLQSIAFNLKERREQAKEKLPLEQERLVHQLWIDGYQGWNSLYTSYVSELSILSPSPGQSPVSVAQAYNYLNHSDRQIRQKWFHRWEETWKFNENLFAQILNHLAGFRLNLYTARNFPEILHEPLLCNRMQEKTLNTMWKVIDQHKSCLQKYLACKARLLGVKRLAWYDVEAPLPLTSISNIPFQTAAELIIQNFSTFSPPMGAFAQQAFENNWIEAEDRSDKHPGGFCVSFTHKKQSRIFMTYSGTMSNVFTLAHELGHAYHSYEVRDLPIFAQQYKMNVAETASTLAEMVTIDSMIEKTKDSKTKLGLIDNKLQRAVLFLMNIQARFLFELDFYQERRKGFVLANELNFLMEKAQKQAFGDIFSEWHPHFWAAKQHFYSTSVPFYNFPYTFGYLFSQGIYAHLKQEKNSAMAYAELLRDTGRLSTEELAFRHLGVKLEEPYFWENAVNLIEQDVATYLSYL